jgi:hypothetical protein
MKTSQRIPKAIVVIVIVGIGLLHNMKDRSIVMEPFREMTAELDRNQLESDSLQNSENKLFVYSKSIINTSIHYIISKL